MGMAKYWSPFKVTTNTKIIASMELESQLAVGLKILTTKTYTHSNPIFQRNQIPSSHSYPSRATCFLKSCFLCHKHLSLNKEVYMYRGDQGFCSEECRSRQMYIDDLAQLEITTKKMRILRQSLNAGRCINDRHKRHPKRSTASPIFS